jgi:hypothetical protein
VVNVSGGVVVDVTVVSWFGSARLNVSGVWSAQAAATVRGRVRARTLRAFRNMGTPGVSEGARLRGSRRPGAALNQKRHQ